MCKIKRFQLSFFFVILFLFYFFGFAYAAPSSLWKRGGVVVNDSLGNTVQQNPKIARADNLNYFMVFEDFRSGNADLYIQKLDEDGNRLFGKKALPLATALNEQIFPQIIADQAGGAFVIWQDNRKDNFDIYLQKIDSEGNSIFQKDGLLICGASSGQVFPEIAPDGSGGALITWFDYRSGEEDVYAQRIDANGNILWGKDGIPVCINKSTQWFPKIMADGSGGAFVVWVDRRSGDFDIYAQHLNSTGKKLWNDEGLAVCKIEGNQEKPQLVSNGENGIYIAWSDGRANNQGVFVQQIKLNGSFCFTENGLKVANIFLEPSAPQIISDGAKGCIVVWGDSQAGDSDIYMQRISVGGKLLWGEEGKPVVQKAGVQENPRIIGNSSFYIIWEETKSQIKNVYFQKINREAYFYYPYGGVPICKSQHNIQNYSLSLSYNQDLIAVFQDDREGNFDIYAQKILNNGGYAWGESGKAVNDVIGSVAQQNFKVSSDNSGAFYFAFEDKRSGYSNIYAQKLNSQGFLIWDVNAVPCNVQSFDQKAPDIVVDGKGGAYVVWEDYKDSSGCKIYAQHFNQEGDSTWSEGILLTPSLLLSNQEKPIALLDNNGGIIVIFVCGKNSLGQADIYAQRISSKGKLLWGNSGKIISSNIGKADAPTSVSKSLISAWTDYRNGEKNSNVYCQKIDDSGNVLWGEGGLAVCEAPDIQRDVVLVEDGDSSVVVAWADRGSGNFDIYAQRLDSRGQILWAKDGVPVCQTGRTQQRPKMISIATAEVFLVWEDFRYGNWDIFAQKLDSQGKPVFIEQANVGEDGLPVCSTLGTQYSPDIAQIGKNSVVVWEDYRNNSNYSIYLQSFDNKGDISFDENGVLLKDTELGARLPRIIASSNKKEFLVAWEDYKNGGKAIIAQKYRF